LRFENTEVRKLDESDAVGRVEHEDLLKVLATAGLVPASESNAAMIAE
jgi:hypothetical protein